MRAPKGIPATIGTCYTRQKIDLAFGGKYFLFENDVVKLIKAIKGGSERRKKGFTYAHASIRRLGGKENEIFGKEITGMREDKKSKRRNGNG